MTFDYRIEPEENLIRMRCTGEFTIDELIEHTRRVNNDPLFRPGMNTIGDYREARWIGDVREINRYVDHTGQLEEVRGACKWAVLVPGESARKLIEMFNLITQGRKIAIETRAFGTEAEAMRWITEDGGG